MRPKHLFVILALIAFAVLATPSFFSHETAEASALLQSLPNLDGINIYFTEANREVSRFDQSPTGLSRFAGLLRRQGANLFTLEWRTRFPTDADLIVLAGPSSDLSPDQTARLWAYIVNGGKLLLMIDPTGINGARWAENSGLLSLMWNDLSILGQDDVVVAEDTESESGGLISRFETTDFNLEHPITAQLAGPLQVFTARSVLYDASPRDFQVAPLVMSPSNFYGETDYSDYLESGVFNYDIGSDTSQGNLALSVALEDPRILTRIVLVGDKDFAINGAGFETSPVGSASFLYPENVRFMMNAAAWLVEAEIVDYEFPTPGPTATPSTAPSLTPIASPTPAATNTPVPTATATDLPTAASTPTPTPSA